MTGILQAVGAQGPIQVLDLLDGMITTAFTTGGEQSAAVGDDTHVVYLLADKLCYIAAGLNPTAANTTGTLWPGVYLPVHVKPGWKIAFKGLTEGGTGWVMKVR